MKGVLKKMSEMQRLQGGDRLFESKNQAQIQENLVLCLLVSLQCFMPEKELEWCGNEGVGGERME